jgi:hypothetical protein
MSWTYAQSSGNLSHNGEFIAKGYAGIGAGVNNPAAQNQPFQGPLPQGTYTIDPVVQDGGHMGPYVLPLEPWPVNNMFGRAGFYIHGDTPARNQTASNGCIVLDRQWRALIATSGDSTLLVVA